MVGESEAAMGRDSRLLGRGTDGQHEVPPAASTCVLITESRCNRRGDPADAP